MLFFIHFTLKNDINESQIPTLKYVLKLILLRTLSTCLHIDLRIEDLNLSDTGTHSSGSENEYEPRGKLDPGDRLNPFQSSSRLSVRSSLSNMSDLEFPRPKSVSLHKHMTYEEYRLLQYQKFKRAGALGVLGKDKYVFCRNKS